MAVVEGHHVLGRQHRHIPAVLEQPVPDVGAVLEVPELLEVGEVVLLASQLSRQLAVTLHLRSLPVPDIGVVEVGTGRLDGDLAADDGQRLDALKQQILGCRRQKRQQPSTVNALGAVASKPACCNAVGQSCRKSTGTLTRLAIGCAPALPATSRT